jgi:hypothetical protein
MAVLAPRLETTKVPLSSAIRMVPLMVASRQRGRWVVSPSRGVRLLWGHDPDGVSDGVGVAVAVGRGKGVGGGGRVGAGVTARYADSDAGSMVAVSDTTGVKVLVSVICTGKGVDGEATPQPTRSRPRNRERPTTIARIAYPLGKGSHISPDE